MKPYKRIGAACLLVLACMTACSKGGSTAAAGGGGGTTVDTIIDGLHINPSAVVMDGLGSSSVLELHSGTTVLNNADAVWTSSNELVVTVSAGGVVTAVSEGEATVSAVWETLSASVPVVIDTNAYYISGTVAYEDKQYDTQGFTGATAALPVRYAVVQMVDSLDRVVQTSATDANGNYRLGPFVDLQGRVRVIAQTPAQNQVPIGAVAIPAFTVTDYDGNLYAASKVVTAGQGNQLAMDVLIAVQSGGGAFNILSVFTYAAQYTGGMSSLSLSPLAAVWEADSSALGTYFCHGLNATYCPQGSAVYILGGGSPYFDSDEYDDDVLWHEFSHYLEQNFALSDSPGGSHSFADNDLDLRLAWSEGFGDFFPAAMKAWMRVDYPAALSGDAGMDATYVDTAGSIASVIDIGNPGGSPFVYASNEIAIAHVMLQLHDLYGMAALWSVYENQLPVTTGMINIEAFWDGWLNERNPSGAELAQLESVYADRRMYYQEDSYESDDTDVQAQLLAVCAAGQSCAGQTHYLYKNSAADDADFIQFTALAGKIYRIETFALSNGADTYLRVYDVDGLILQDNDDRSGSVCCLPNDALTLSSLIEFTAGGSATYFVEIRTSLDRAASAGRYGTYSIKITEQ